MLPRLDLIPEEIAPMEALARSALADPMVGSPVDGRLNSIMTTPASRLHPALAEKKTR